MPSNQNRFKTNMNKKYCKGFSLLELAIVITVVTFLMSNIVMIFEASMDVYKESKNRDRIAAVQKALTNYFAKHQRLPCPSNPFLPHDHPDYGKESINTTNNECVLTFSRTNATTGDTRPPLVFLADTYTGAGFTNGFQEYIIFGGVPVRDLGLKSDMAFDVYGKAYTFIVPFSLTLMNRTPLLRDGGSFSNTPARINGVKKYIKNAFLESGVMKYVYGVVMYESSATNNIGIRQNNMFLYDEYERKTDGMDKSFGYYLISHGKNGYGAWKKDGTLHSLNPTMDALENNNSYLYNVNTKCSSFQNCQLACSWNGAIGMLLCDELKLYTGQKYGVLDDLVVYDTLENLIMSTDVKRTVMCSAASLRICHDNCVGVSPSSMVSCYNQGARSNFGLVRYGEKFKLSNVATNGSVNCGVSTPIDMTCDGMGNLY